MDKGQKKIVEKGMARSVVIVNSVIVAMQFKRLAKQSGVYERERYIDDSSVDNWEEIGTKWLENKMNIDV